MPNVGRDAAGRPFVVNPSGGNGIRFTSITPAGETITSLSVTDLGTTSTQSSRDVNGAMKNPARGSPGKNGFVDVDFHSVQIAYDSGENVDPGKTASNITFAAGEEGVIYKTKVDAEPVNAATPMQAMASFHVLASTPTANSFLNGPSRSDQTPRWTSDDIIDLSTLPTLAIQTGNPSVNAVLGNLRWTSIAPWGQGSAAGHMTCSMNNPAGEYPVRSIGPQVCYAILLLCQDITLAEKDEIARALISTAIDAYDYLDNRTSGLDYGGENGEAGLGGIAHRGYKEAIGAAGILLNDTDLKNMAATAQFAQNGQIRNLDQDTIDATQSSGLEDYESYMLGAPEWTSANQYFGAGTAGDMRAGASYRGITARYFVLYALAAHVFPGLKTVLDYQPTLDYADRIMERYFLPSAGSANASYIDQWARTVTATDKLTVFDETAWDAWRASEGGTIWDWPA